jgi:hypothetical protein
MVQQPGREFGSGGEAVEKEFADKSSCIPIQRPDVAHGKANFQVEHQAVRIPESRKEEDHKQDEAASTETGRHHQDADRGRCVRFL